MRALRTAFFLAVPVVIAVACGGTTKTQGELMVSVQTDMAMPKDIDTLGLYVFSGGSVVFGDDFKVGTDLKLPATIGVVGGNTPDAPVRIRLTARKNNQLIVMTEVTTTVPNGRLALLRMPIQWLCTGQATDPQGATDLSDLDEGATSNCGGTQQCVAGTCVDEAVDSSTLPAFDPTLVFGGAAAPGENGTCLDTLGCFASGFVESVDTTDCTIPKPSGGDGLNVALVQSPNGAGICGPEACLIPLDQASDVGWSDLDNGRLQLPQGVCTQLTAKTFLGVAVTTSCATKTEAVPTCGPWNSSSSNLGTTDAGAPDGSLLDASPVGESDGSPNEGPDAAASIANEAGASEDGSASTCAAFTVNESVCDPIAKTGCANNQECAASTTVNATACVPEGTVALGGTCNGGALCGPGLYCLQSVCMPYCCSSSDCTVVDASLVQCSQQSAAGGTFFGVCESF